MAITSSNYEPNYEDEQFKKVDADLTQREETIKETYGGMIGKADKFYQDLADQSQKWADEQVALQQDQTDFAIEKIEQQKEQAYKDYLKEQSGAYVDWRKQSNQYGTEAEKMASAGLQNTGFSESSQVSMYNTYQSRVASAREVMSQAKLNYENNIQEAILQNNAAMAEIYANAYKEQLELALQGYLHNEQLTLEMNNKLDALNDTKWNRYQDVLTQMNTQNALKAEIDRYNDNQKWQTEQAELDRNHQLQRDELNRKFEAEQAELNKQHDFAILEAKTKAEKELAEQEHQRAMEKLKKQQEYELAQLNQKLANDKDLLSYENSLKKTQISGGNGDSSESSEKGRVMYSSPIGPQKATTFSNSYTPTTYSQAVQYAKNKGVPAANASGIWTQSEWSRRKNSSTTSSAIKATKSYQEYLKYYTEYLIDKYGK